MYSGGGGGGGGDSGGDSGGDGGGNGGAQVVVVIRDKLITPVGVGGLA